MISRWSIPHYSQSNPKKENANCAPLPLCTFIADTAVSPQELPSVDPRLPEPRHPLPLRPPDHARAAGRAPAPRAALAHPDPRLHAQGRAGEAFRQLAAGSAVELPGAAGVPGKDPRAEDRSRAHGRTFGDQPVRFLPRAGRRKDPVQLRRGAAARACALSGQTSAHAAVREVPRLDSREPDAVGRFPGRPDPAPAEGHPLSHTHGARRPDAGGDAGQRERLLPRHRLAAGAASAPPRARRAFRLGLPDPAQGRREIARRAFRAPKSTSPTSTHGARSTCRARAGSASIRPPASSRAKATSRSPARRSPAARRRSPGSPRKAKPSSRTR